MNEFRRLVKMECMSLRNWQNWVPLLYAFAGIVILCSVRVSMMFAVGATGIYLLALCGWPGGFSEKDDTQGRYYLFNVFRVILPAPPWKVGLASLTPGILSLLAMYGIVAGFVALRSGLRPLDPAVWPFVFWLYAQTVFFLLASNQDQPLGRKVFQEICWWFSGFALPLMTFAMAADAWSWLVMLAAGVLTTFHCLRAWKYLPARRRIPLNIRLTQALVLAAGLALVVWLNWQGDLGETINHGMRRMHADEESYVR